MRTLATKFEKRGATIVLKGMQKIDRWIADVQEDRIITYPLDASHTAADLRKDIRREPYRYAQIETMIELAGGTPKLAASDPIVAELVVPVLVEA
jgi:hypothetical protein